MASTPEKKVKDACVKIIKEFHAYYFYPVQGGFGRAGVPDLCICYRGLFLAVECKAGINKTTALQDREIATIHAAGGAAMVINEYNIPALRAWFERNGHE